MIRVMYRHIIFYYNAQYSASCCVSYKRICKDVLMSLKKCRMFCVCVYLYILEQRRDWGGGGGPKEGCLENVCMMFRTCVSQCK
jgi:hypothetical protein